MAKINISTKKHPNCFAIVDDGDFGRLNQRKWCCSNQGYVTRYKYLGIKDGKKRGRIIRMHHLVNGMPPEGLEADHINGNKLDNRKKNLRFCTRSQNQMNKQPKHNGSSRYKGVQFRSDTKKWEGRIKLHGKETYLGTFLDEESAARAYDAKARELFGEFAKLNFPRR